MCPCLHVFECHACEHMQNDRDTVIERQSLDVVAEAVITGQATQIYWALQYGAFPLSLMTAKRNESRWLCYSTVRVKYPQSWTKVLTSYHVYFMTNIYVHVWQEYKSFAGHPTDHTYFCLENTNKVMNYSLHKYRHEKMFLYLGMCTHKAQTNSNTPSQHEQGATGCANSGIAFILVNHKWCRNKTGIKERRWAGLSKPLQERQAT